MVMVEFMHGLTLGNPLPSKLSLGVKLSELGQSIGGIYLGLNRLNVSCNEYIMILNELIQTKDLRENSS